MPRRAAVNQLNRRSFLSRGIGAGALAAWPRSGWAQAYPQRPIRILVPFVAGGATDTLARIIGELLRGSLGQTVVVENRAGGNSAIGMTGLATAVADGYTLVAGHIGTHAITPAITPPTTYDVAKGFTTIAVHATSSNLLVVPADSKVDSVATLLATAKSKPGALNYGSPGVGSPSHIVAVQMATLTGLDIVHVPYRGNAAAVTDLLGGRLDFMFASPAEVLEHVKSGKLRALAATGAKRAAATPDIAPLASLGVPGIDFHTWHVVSARSDTPADIVATLRKAVSAAMATDTYKKRLSELSLDSGIADGVEADKFVQSEIGRWARFVKEANIKAE